MINKLFGKSKKVNSNTRVVKLNNEVLKQVIGGVDSTQEGRKGLNAVGDGVK